MYIPKKDEELLEQFGKAIIELDIDDKELYETLNFHRQMLELETPSIKDQPYHKLRLWMSKNLYQVIQEDYLNAECDQDVEDMLKIFPWIIKYLTEISILVKDDQIEKNNAIKKLIKRLLYLFKTDVYLSYRTDSKVYLTELIIEFCNKQESSNESAIDDTVFMI
jgi:hypothetical protein